MTDTSDPPPPLSTEDRARIMAAVHGPAPDWPMPPILPGPWTDAEPAVAFDLLEMAGRYLALGALRQPVPVAHELCRVRHRPLRSYGDAILVEALAQVPRLGIVSFILHRDGVLFLNGESGPIHLFNQQHPVVLATDEARADYVQLFMNWVRSDLGRFEPLESAAAVAHRLDAATLARVTPHASPWIIEADPEAGGFWSVTGPVLYGGQVFAVQLTLSASGGMFMRDDTEIVKGLALRRERMSRLLLWLGDDFETDPQKEDS